jgi:hypothetical protein
MSSSIDQIPSEVIQAGGNKLCSDIHKFTVLTRVIVAHFFHIPCTASAFQNFIIPNTV